MVSRLHPLLACCAFTLLAVLAGGASGANVGVVAKVKVGVTGRNSTRGLAPTLFVDVPVVADYRQVRFDGEQGEWRGPDSHATQSPGTNETTITLRSEFQDDAGSLDGMVKQTAVHTTWQVVARSKLRMPRLLAGRNVGSVGGLAVLLGEPIAGSARFEAIVALPLCHGVFAGIELYASAPAQDVSGSAGQYLVGTTPAKQWNHDHALAATRGVALDGNLPGARVSVRRTGEAVTGAVGDCGGGLQNVPVVLQRKAGTGWRTVHRGVSGPGGRFRLAAAGAGSYRILARLGPFGAVSAATAVR